MAQSSHIQKSRNVRCRFLENEKDALNFNAWDDVEWSNEQNNLAKKKISDNSSQRVSEEDQDKYDKQAPSFWDAFYDVHQNRFFKDRKWLFLEFPELDQLRCSDKLSVYHQERSPDTCSSDITEDFIGCTNKIRMLEAGCGVGNSVFPLLEGNKDPNLFCYCCDFSDNAISIIKSNPDLDKSRCYPFVHDLIKIDQPFPFPPNSLDIVLLLFVLSSIKPSDFVPVVSNLARHLKPGGRIFFRDYGQFDMAQLRFKNGRCLSDNFYVRGDGTRVYFFSEDEVRKLFVDAGLTVLSLNVDRRLQVNRGKQLKMYRVWIQGRFEKPFTNSNNSSEVFRNLNERLNKNKDSSDITHDEKQVDVNTNNIIE